MNVLLLFFFTLFCPFRGLDFGANLTKNIALLSSPPPWPAKSTCARRGDRHLFRYHEADVDLLSGAGHLNSLA